MINFIFINTLADYPPDASRDDLRGSSTSVLSHMPSISSSMRVSLPEQVWIDIEPATYGSRALAYMLNMPHCEAQKQGGFIPLPVLGGSSLSSIRFAVQGAART